MFVKVIAMDAQERPAKRSNFVGASKNLRQIAQDDLKTLPAKE